MMPSVELEDGRPSFRTAVASDFREAGWRRRVALAGVVGWLAYEWGAGNEVVTPWLLAHVISVTSGALAIPTTAVVGFAFTTLQQLASGLTALAGFSTFDRTATAGWARLGGKTRNIPGEWSTLSLPSRCALVFGLGTTAVALIQIVSTGQVGVKRHLGVVVQSAVLCGALVSCIGGAGAALVVVGRNIEVLAEPTQWTVRVLGNPMFWIGLLLIGVLIGRVRRRGPARRGLIPKES